MPEKHIELATTGNILTLQLFVQNEHIYPMGHSQLAQIDCRKQNCMFHKKRSMHKHIASNYIE